MTYKQPKILYLITKSNFGGAQKYVFELACEAKKRGYSATVACGGTGNKQSELGQLATKLKDADVPVLPIKHFMRDISLVEEFRAFFEIISILRKERPDVFHVTSSKAGGLGALAGRLAGVKKIVFTSHGLTMDESWRPQWQRLLISFFTWLTVLLSHNTIMISTETFNRVRQMPLLSKRVSLVFNGIASVTFRAPDEARQALLPNQTLPDDVVLVGGNGELHPNKNWGDLIKALPSLPQNVRLLIIGEGEQRASLEKLITELGLQNKVYLPGYINDAAQYYRAFDVFVLPSKKEGLPYVLLEAGLASLPTVASNLPGIKDIIIDGENGLLVEPEPTILADTLKKIVRDRNRQKQLGERLNITINRKFSVDRMFKETFAVYSPSNISSDF